MRLKTLATAATLVALAPGASACSTADIAGLIKASEANKDCYMATSVTMTPMLLFGFVIPVFSGKFDKVCHADKAPRGIGPALAPGQLVAPLGAPPAVPASDPAPA
jgi:hypothetical protein